MTDILIVEDEPAILESLQFILSRDGWVVDVVHDGEAALEAVARLKPRLLVLDIMLPKLSGLEVLKTIRSHEATRDITVLVLTARGQQYDRQLAMDLKANAFMTKPYANSEVLAEVRRMLGDGGDA